MNQEEYRSGPIDTYHNHCFFKWHHSRIDPGSEDVILGSAERKNVSYVDEAASCWSRCRRRRLWSESDNASNRALFELVSLDSKIPKNSHLFPNLPDRFTGAFEEEDCSIERNDLLFLSKGT